VRNVTIQGKKGKSKAGKEQDKLENSTEEILAAEGSFNSFASLKRVLSALYPIP
jgi:hypothetical protein